MICMISVNGEYRIAVGYKRLLQLKIEKNMSYAELMQKAIFRIIWRKNNG